MQSLLRRKTELLPLLRGLHPEEELWFGERAAIAEYDGGLSRAEAEQLAWRQLQAARHRPFPGVMTHVANASQRSS